MSIYNLNKEQKHQIAQEVLDKGLTLISKKYNIPLAILAQWTKDYEEFVELKKTGFKANSQLLKIRKLETENSVLRERLMEECKIALFSTMKFLNKGYLSRSV